MLKKYSILFLWIIHLSALIGVALGHKDFFFPKSWGTMLYLLLLLVLWFPLKKVKEVLLFVGFITVGIGVEWVGVHTNKLFGSYYYLENLGLKLDGIPYLIGVNWAILVFITHIIAKRWISSRYLVATIGAGLMVFIDVFLEQICEYTGFWKFEQGAGWYNYLCWFVIAWLLHLICFSYKLKGDLKVSYHLYFVQLFFATTLWIIISI